MLLQSTPYPIVEPLPVMPRADRLRYWFAADQDAYSSADATTKATDGDGVQFWANNGLAADNGVQPSAGARPIFRTGGLNGKPYLDCPAGQQLWFNDLLEGDHAGGILGGSPFSFAAVVDGVPNDGLGKALFGTKEVGENTFSKGRVSFGGDGSVLYFLKLQVSITCPNPNGPNVVFGQMHEPMAKFRHGTHAYGPTLVTQTTNAYSTGNDGLRFLRHGSTPGKHFTGRLYEILYWNTGISVADGQAALDYLAAKYQIS